MSETDLYQHRIGPLPRKIKENNLTPSKMRTSPRGRRRELSMWSACFLRLAIFTAVCLHQSHAYSEKIAKRSVLQPRGGMMWPDAHAKSAKPNALQHPQQLDEGSENARMGCGMLDVRNDRINFVFSYILYIASHQSHFAKCILLQAPMLRWPARPHDWTPPTSLSS